ncbi:DUF6305 family protein [bacterium]|nr:DUF6305 family protein [bacterium]
MRSIRILDRAARAGNPPAIAVALAFIAAFALCAAAGAQQNALPKGLPELKGPILITACGQSPGGVYVKVVCRQVKLEADLEETATVQTLGARAYKTLIVITGTSLKGMGSAGVELSDEIKRCTELVKKAKASGVKVIVAQVEGASRRVDESDEQSIRSMTPLADLLITHNQANKDGYFTKTAAEKKIPQIFIDQQLDLVKIFPQIFSK